MSRIALRRCASVLLALFSCIAAHRALAQEAASCAPAVGRLVSVQGNVDVQRAGTQDWMRIKRLDTSVCTGDRVRTAPLSRAALFVQPETLLRVDQNTTIALSQTTAEIVVEFFQDDVIQAARDAQSCGAGYFITRFPKKLRVTTPHMNAAVEGTEFEVDVRCASTELAVIEGTVRSRNLGTGEERMVTGGELLTAGPSSPAVFTTLVKPTDAVEWALYYPPLSDSKSVAEISSAEQCRAMTPPANQACLTQRAEALLRAGQSDEASSDLNAVLAAEPGNGDASALKAIIEIARSNRAAALESAKAATAASPDSYRTWLALSYAQQASFELESALESAKKAQQLQPASALINARIAELLMSLGRIDEAEAAARTNVTADPGESRAHSVLGFVRLAQIDTQEARAAFTRAIELDSFDPLPRLGLGLATIRDGDLAAGREQLEIALALDPGSSLLRSYLGKAYYEEKRDKLAAEQLSLAKTADPRDPTPWLYDALRLQSINRPVDAAHDMRHSVELNDNRAVFRSRLLLDEDLAARGAGLGGIYRNLGFEQLALIEGYQAVSADPGSHSGHRLLADHYDSLPHHEIARVNELFRSQVLQPLNTTPIPVQLGQASLFLNSANGTTDVSFNEFTQLFDRDQLRIRASAMGGENDTRGDDLTISGISNRFSFNLGQYLFETDGFRENNDSKQEVYSAFAQFAISHDTSVLAELRSTESDEGDLNLLFNPDSFDPSLRQTEDTDSTRLGLRHDFTPRSQLLASLLYQDAQVRARFDPGFEFDETFKGYTAELQHIYRRDRWNLTTGIRYFDLDQDGTETTVVFLPDPPFIEFFTDTVSLAFEDLTGYIYSDFDLGSQWRVTLGASATSSEGRSFDEDQINPKVGVVWRPSNGTTLRAAAVRTLQPSTFSRSNIQPYLEPTEVSGFNQFFSGVAGEDVKRYGVAIDQEFSDNVRAGLEASKREIEIPVTVPGPPDQSFVFDTEERNGRAYVFWTPAGVRNVALRAEYQYDEQLMEEFPEFGTTSLETRRVPLGISYFSRSGLSVDLLATHVDQEGEFLEFLPVPPFVNTFTDDDQFWVVDASLSYRLPKRYGLVTLTAKNLLDEEFKFQDIDPSNPTLLPERMVLLRVTIDFSIQ
jgi:Tfp pilus assembly protein PilF